MPIITNKQREEIYKADIEVGKKAKVFKKSDLVWLFALITIITILYFLN